MSNITVRFEWLSGLRRPMFDRCRLVGSWDGAGRYADRWSAHPMLPFTADDGCPAWYTTVAFDPEQSGWTFHWGVVADGAQQKDLWVVPTEGADPASSQQHRSFVLGRADAAAVERYHFTDCRRFGANKRFAPSVPAPALAFSVWAPNARAVDVVIGDLASGYIHDDGRGIARVFATSRSGDGLWRSEPHADLADFAAWDHKPYMYRITADDGSVRLRSDIYSRCQIGSGRRDPADASAHWDGTRQDLKGTKSCSLVIDPERVTAELDEGVFPETKWLTEAEFWADEYDSLRPVPGRLEELVIYEMHVEGLGAGRPTPGRFADAIAMLDHLVELGINAVEFLPTSEAESWSWGYGTSHPFATEAAGGGRDQLKHFVRACHRRGIAVLIDVVYNHYVADAERSQWLYDTATHSRSPYYWYEGDVARWPHPDGGYVDNGSSGYTPAFHREAVRRMFCSSAAMLVSEFHVDGFRVDLAQAIHQDNRTHGDGAPVPNANAFGVKFLREWVRTLRLIKPSIILVAEDYTGWDALTTPQRLGGVGFDAIWWAEWYHNLIGDSQENGSDARLLHAAGPGGDGPLAMGRLAEVIAGTPGRVVYNESHDQAGNATYRSGSVEVASARTLMVAAGGQLDGDRSWAEARCRVAAGLTLLNPGTPMFFMGEEAGAREPYRYNDWFDHREDILGLTRGDGAGLFAFYRDLIRERLRDPALLSPNITVVHAHDANRVIAFRRWFARAEVLVVASLNNAPFARGYVLSHAAIQPGSWTETLNSDARGYGGTGLANPGLIASDGGRIEVALPANGLLVLRRL